MDECGHGIYTQLDTSLLPPLHLIYAENPSDSGKVFNIQKTIKLNKKIKLLILIIIITGS